MNKSEGKQDKIISNPLSYLSDFDLMEMRAEVGKTDSSFFALAILVVLNELVEEKVSAG